LRQLTALDLRFIGLMGSATKIKRIFQELHELGVPCESTAKIEAPVGIAINNRTPAEIGISIAARLIQVKNQGAT